MFHVDSAPDANFDRTFLSSMRWPSPRLIDEVLADLPPDSLPDDPCERQRWLLYALLQYTADAQNLDALAWANEDRINEYLDLIANGELPEDLLDLRVWLKHIPSNRTQKHVRRRHLLKRFRNDLLSRQRFPRPEAKAEQDDQKARVWRLTSDREWRLLNRAAVEGLEAIAESEGLQMGTVKSLLSRCRARLRQSS